METSIFWIIFRVNGGTWHKVTITLIKKFILISWYLAIWDLLLLGTNMSPCVYCCLQLIWLILWILKGILVHLTHVVHWILSLTLIWTSIFCLFLLQHHTNCHINFLSFLHLPSTHFSLSPNSSAGFLYLSFGNLKAMGILKYQGRHAGKSTKAKLQRNKQMIPIICSRDRGLLNIQCDLTDLKGSQLLLHALNEWS